MEETEEIRMVLLIGIDRIWADYDLRKLRHGANCARGNAKLGSVLFWQAAAAGEPKNKARQELRPSIPGHYPIANSRPVR
jgi:hypothetical protein